jgi:hypothetical protein
MKQAFIIMQIGNLDLDNICKDVFVPVLKACGLDPKRVDKHNEGGLLKSKGSKGSALDTGQINI